MLIPVLTGLVCLVGMLLITTDKDDPDRTIVLVGSTIVGFLFGFLIAIFASMVTYDEPARTADDILVIDNTAVITPSEEDGGDRFISEAESVTTDCETNTFYASKSSLNRWWSPFVVTTWTVCVADS